jgi:hypothetical protein
MPAAFISLNHDRCLAFLSGWAGGASGDFAKLPSRSFTTQSVPFSETSGTFPDRQAYATFVAAFREASDRLRAGDRTARFPIGSFPPGLPFVVAEAVGPP